MDKVAQEIDSLTTPKTVEGRALRIPEGQKTLRAGFKAINHQGLRDRFACDKVQEALDKAVIDSVIRGKGFDPEYAEIIETQYWRNIHKCMVKFRPYSWRFSLFGKRVKSFGSTICEFPERHDLKECRVKIEKVDEYIADKIPDRCLESLHKAMEAGREWDTFRVAYPVIELLPQKDPILLSVIGTEFSDLDRNTYLEIDMWE